MEHEKEREHISPKSNKQMLTYEMVIDLCGITGNSEVTSAQVSSLTYYTMIMLGIITFYRL